VHKKIIQNKKFIALILTFIILFSGYAPFLAQYLNTSNTSETESKNQLNPSFLYLNNVTNTDYTFDAKGECFIIVEIEGIDFTWFALDGEIYNVSYGLNIFPIKFGESYDSHQIIMDISNLEFFKSFTVEPLIIAEGILNTRLDQDSIINFQAGGMISVLTRPSFLYNWLYIELVNETGKNKVLKDIYDIADYPEVDPLFYCLVVEQGSYIRYDLNLDPGKYKLIFRGDGDLEYKIVVNSDWDRDLIDDVEELQQEAFYNFNLNPIIPDIWGFYEKSDKDIHFTEIEETDYMRGLFSFYIPESYLNNELSIRVKSGIFKEITIDGNSTKFQGRIFNADRESEPDTGQYGLIEAGWHQISYEHKVNFTSEIEFLINDKVVKVLNIPEFVDTDGDGIKDIDEYTSGLNSSKIDTDDDGIPDNFDASPLTKLVLNQNRINQMIIPTEKEKNTIINVQIKKPTNDYSTNGVPRLWRWTYNVSIYPVLRMYGNECPISIDNDTKVDMTQQRLINWWRPSTTINLFKSDEALEKNYNEKGNGDPLPNPSNLNNSEFFFIFPKPSESSYEYEIKIPKGHGSKSDGLLDLRFDFIWLVTTYSPSGNTSILHYYDFEENIIIQSMVKREISDGNYILGNPDGLIEHQILWTLTQNPTLGTPDDYGVSDDIIGQGFDIDYFKLPDQIIMDRKNSPLKVNETEVLYYTGSYQNYDVLNKINLRTMQNPNFATRYFGDFEACFSFSVICNVYDGYYFFGDSEIQCENKILYQIYNENCSENGNYYVQKKYNILDMPIAMETNANSKVLLISQAQGSGLFFEEIPQSITSELSEKISLKHQTYIQRSSSDQSSGALFLNFQEGDIYKEIFDNRGGHDEWDHQFFTHESGAELLMNQVNEFWSTFDSIDNYLNELRAEVDTPLPQAYLTIEQILNEFRLISYSELIAYTDFFRFATDLEQISFRMNPNNDFSPRTAFNIAKNIRDAVAEVCARSGKNFHKILISEPFGFQGNIDWNSINTRPRSNAICDGRPKPQINKAKCWGVACCVFGVIMIVFAIWELVSLGEEEDEIPESEFGIRMAAAICNLILGVTLLVDGLFRIFATAKETLATAAKICTVISIVISFLVLILDVAAFFSSGADTSGGDFTIFIINVVISVIGIAIGTSALLAGAAFASAISIVTIGFAVVVVAIFLIDLIWSLTQNNPDLTTCEETGLELSNETQENMRRHGSLEIGDLVTFRLRMKNTGDRPMWIRARFIVLGGDWEGFYSYVYDDNVTGGTYGKCLGQSGWKGRWGSGVYYNYWSYDPYGQITGDDYKRFEGSYTSGEVYDEIFNSKIYGATPNLAYNLEYEVDWQKKNWYPPYFERKTASRATEEDTLGMPVCENSISSFNESTTEFQNLDLARIEFFSALAEFRYKDANDWIRKGTEEIFGIDQGWLNYLDSRLEDYNSSYYKVHTDNDKTFMTLIREHYDEGFRAKNLSSYFWYFGFPGFGFSGFGFSGFSRDFYRHYYAGPESNYDILVPKAWFDNATSVFNEFTDLRKYLIITTNIKIDLRGSEIDIDKREGKVDVNLKLHLEGPDTQRWCRFRLKAPEGFSIHPQEFYGKLSSTLHFTLNLTDPNLELGVYFIELGIELEIINKTISDYVDIYSGLIPVRYKGYSEVKLETYTATEPIVPGEIFNTTKVINSGAYVELLNVSVTGNFTDNFIYKGFYPYDFIKNTQTFALKPGESRIGLALNPPRHYTTKPGIYYYDLHVLDIEYGKDVILFSDTFEVAEFYDMDFQCINPEITIFDYQTGTYTFKLTNLGNVPQKFTISFDDIPFADGYLSEDVICLGPGETQLITLTITPTGWGEKEFFIKAISEGNSTTIIGKITINDDDVNPPEITNFEIIETPIDVTVKFDIWNEMEGDDQGISNIKIFIDDELILEYIPDPLETCFSFTFNDTHGFWFMEKGTHEIRVELIDNDFDVPNDALNSSMSGTFETELKDMYLYVDWQIEVLKNYTDTHLCWLMDKMLSHKLSIAQKHLEIAYILAEQGRITCGLFHDTIAKIMIEITEFRTEIFNKINFINDEDATYIISSLHTIRNNIVLLLGTTSGTEQGIPLALIEINLLNLNDFIEDNINWWDRKCLTCYIECATKSLEIAIFKASMDHGLECALSCVQWKLELAKNKVNCLLNKGKISQDLADIILFEIEQAQNDIEAVKNTL
jgi:hypothetical protein